MVLPVVGVSVMNAMVSQADSDGLRDGQTTAAVETPTIPDRYDFDPRAADERCPNCGSSFVYHDEDAGLAPTCLVFVCEDHFLRAGGDCPGATIRVYEDGFISRTAFGAE